MKSYKLFNSTRLLMALSLILTISYSSIIANNPVKSNKTIVEIAVSNDDFSILVDALAKAELVDALNSDGPFTVFAPTNDAFEDLFKELGISGLSELTKDQLTPILLYHVVDGKVMASSVSTGTVPTLNKKASLDIEASKKGVTLNTNSSVIKTDIEASNGVIHVIDAILIPSSTSKTTEDKGGSCD